jgi:hypothetical protein
MTPTAAMRANGDVEGGRRTSPDEAAGVVLSIGCLLPWLDLLVLPICLANLSYQFVLPIRLAGLRRRSLLQISPASLYQRIVVDLALPERCLNVALTLP